MNLRRLAVTAGLTFLVVAALLGVWRSVTPTGGDGDPARRLAAELRCPACQGESVADSRSPIAAAMREVIGTQLRQGRDPDEIRSYLVDRYGPEVLAAPPVRGWGLLLWALPVLGLALGLVPAVRTARQRGHAGTTATDRRNPPGRARGGHRFRQGVATVAGDRRWNLGAAALVLALVGAVALAAPRPAPPSPGAADPVADQLTLARSLETQGHYATAAEVYRTVLDQRPADEIRLRLAFTLIRLEQPGEAARLAGEVLAHRPDSPDGLLILGLAQRVTDPGSASATLRRFLSRAPDHPAAAEIRRLLGNG
ncbi:cytochrome c-type biogenesis protein CcmH [Plantactinospora sp. ZYX-F-223]|uniref:cytochrome c-type biogenesis protein CcmH n=1 Tax=Plantactinospora sp. ZYX-F-223 TaxID=3144103 RepID=UPI0031FBAC06